MATNETPVAGSVTLGPPGAGGWRDLVREPAEEHVGNPPAAGSRVLATLVHLSDVHICDAESPARLEYLDRHGDPDAPYADLLGEIGTYRPHEILTVHVAAAMVDTFNRLDAAPVTGAHIDGVLITGDLVDNMQRNELDWYLRVLTGGTVTPASGDPEASSWVGAASAGFWSERFWHPDGDVHGTGSDLPTATYGYPTIPGLVEAARRPVRAPGLTHPWMSVYGNHDGLLQGTVAADARTRAIAVGSRRVVELDPVQTPYAVFEATAALGPARYIDTPTSPSVTVTADVHRRLLVADELVHAHLTLGLEHGFATARTYWSRDVGAVRLVALDTVNPHGGWEGSLDEEQLDWLRSQVRHADRPIVVTSHHPSWTLRNAFTVPGAGRRILADEVLAVLTDAPAVVLWLAGHVHANTVRHHGTPSGGFLEITTASLIDWPQQGRVIEVIAEPDGSVCVATTMLDHAGWWATSSGQNCAADLDDPLVLAGISRALAANDYRARAHPVGVAAMAGPVAARNVLRRLHRH